MVAWLSGRRALGRGRAWLSGAHWACPERHHWAWCEGRMRLAGRGTSPGPGASHTGCILCLLSIPVCHWCRQCSQGGVAWQWVRRRSTVRFR